MVARMIFCRLPKRVTMRSMIGSGRRGIFGEQPEAARLEALVEVELLVGQVQRGADRLEVEQVLGAEVGERLEGLVDVPVGVLVEVVLDHEAAVLLDAAHQLVELEAHEAPLGAELDDPELELLRDPPHHLGALEHVDDVAHGDEVFDLDGAQPGW